MASDDTPGIWQNATCTIVLAHVTSTWWMGLDIIKGHVWCARASADRLQVLTASGPFYIDNVVEGDSFVRALNMYWEIRCAKEAGK